MRKTITVTIKVKPPESGASTLDIINFVADALEWAGGCRRPDDPMFNSLKVKSVKIGTTEALYVEDKRG